MQDSEVAPPVDQSLRVWVFDVGVAMLLFVLPQLLYSLSSFWWPVHTYNLSVELNYTTEFLRVCPVIVYLMYRSKEGFAAFGISRIRPLKDAAGALICLAIMGIVYGAENVAWLNNREWLIDQSPGTGEIFLTAARLNGLAFAWVVLNVVFMALTEELVFRSFLQHRFTQIWSGPVAVLFSSLLFASYHIYQAWSGL